MTKTNPLPWRAELSEHYREQPRIYDADGALVCVVGNAEDGKEDQWNTTAELIVDATNSTQTQ